MPRVHIAGGLVLLLLALVLACSSTSTPRPAPAIDAETAYVEGLDALVGAMNQAVDRFEDIVGPTFPNWAPDNMQARVIFTALEQLDYSGTSAQLAHQAEGLIPPNRFREDHALYVQHLTDQVARAESIDAAVQARNLPHVHLARAELRAAELVARASVSPEFCKHLLLEGTADPGATDVTLGRYCDDSPLPGGDYGLSVNRLAKKFDAEFSPRAGAFPPGLTDDQLLEALTYVQPAIVQVIEETLAKLRQTEPPPELEAGHQVLHDYFDELLSTARAINREVADNDYDGVQREFARSRQVNQTARDRMPDNYRPIVNIIFTQP